MSLCWSARTLTSEKADPGYPSRFATLRDLLGFRVSELHAFGEARTIVEARYLDGHLALFPDLAAAWEAQVRTRRGSPMRLT